MDNVASFLQKRLKNKKTWKQKLPKDMTAEDILSMLRELAPQQKVPKPKTMLTPSPMRYKNPMLIPPPAPTVTNVFADMLRRQYGR